ncbi:MAG: hypothetical protein N2Z74_06790, partial [Syntrophales bacterium]|nr:hypothetical protein [Syntrophales bacterium]
VFKKAMSLDRARVQLSRISKFGILELSRQKKQSTIQEISYTSCPYCRGTGFRPSLEYIALSAFRKIESRAVRGEYSHLKITLPQAVSDYLLNQKRHELARLESDYDMTIHISGDADMPWDDVRIESTQREAAGEGISDATEEKSSPGEEQKETQEKSLPSKTSRGRRRKKKDTAVVAPELRGPEQDMSPMPPTAEEPEKAAEKAEPLPETPEKAKKRSRRRSRHRRKRVTLPEDTAAATEMANPSPPRDGDDGETAVKEEGPALSPAKPKRSSRRRGKSASGEKASAEATDQPLPERLSRAEDTPK